MFRSASYGVESTSVRIRNSRIRDRPGEGVKPAVTADLPDLMFIGLSRTVRQSMPFDCSFCRAGPSYIWVMAHLHGGFCFRRNWREGMTAVGKPASGRCLITKEFLSFS